MITTLCTGLLVAVAAYLALDGYRRYAHRCFNAYMKQQFGQGGN